MTRPDPTEPVDAGPDPRQGPPASPAAPIAGTGLRHLVIGAGPAGLTAAWELTRRGEAVTVLEADPDTVGGLSRTVAYKGNRFDIGGHRFYSKSAEINRLWKEMLPDDFIDVARMSRIYFGRRFFPYPIEVVPTLRTLGLRASTRVTASYLRAVARPRRPERSFEDWVVNRFGRRLYETFFKTYTEKVWGMPCTSIDKDWAAQRIRGLDFRRTITDEVNRRSGRRSAVKTLITSFRYPRLGPGQLWERVRDDVVERGGRVVTGAEVVRINLDAGSATAVETADGRRFECDHLYTTMPLRDLTSAFDPPAPSSVRAAGAELGFRDFLTVALVLDRPDVFPDTWIYVHDPAVRVGRIQNYKNWSGEMVADGASTCLGMEYFCNADDPLWRRSDDELVRQAAADVEAIGLAPAASCVDGVVVRMRDAYPVYDGEYRRHRDAVRSWLEASVSNVHPMGRGGLHNYNSQDHAMMTALLSVRNVLDGTDADVWAVNSEVEYAEEGSSGADDSTSSGGGGERAVPRPLLPSSR
jgi:protoporphyrinogen oxidase